MKRYLNPFTPVFGNEPPILGGRSQLIDNAIKGLEGEPGEPNRITVFTGPRGSGKTVLLNAISDIAKRMKVSLSYAGHYRRRLINQGIISESGRGKIVFSMPMLKELLMKRFGV